MNQEQLASFLLIAGFVSILIASFVGPPRLYQEPDVDVQLRLIATYAKGWAASNLFFGLAGVLTAVGLFLFFLQLRGNEYAWLAGLGTAAYIFGSLTYIIFLYRRTVNPAALFTEYSFSFITIILLASLVIGLLIIGITLLQTGYPAWLGVGMIVGMVLIGGAALIFPATFFKYFPPQALFLFTFVTGIVMWQ